ncbi:Shedu immune nuclease family protein [Clostridium intestinale]|uniref:Shedu immune nuclease family protein n=1 Tax=Clostridium intestinale TaxID=36845 RepID=UPI002DD6A1CA|nr:Shedu immune nuclease family protein [Clostridium intestinale]WRY52600.1 DUF4263 domain-containing protein [Clostridium intestinale]
MKNERLIQDFMNILDNENLNENDIQDFLEINTELIPIPYILGHQVNFSAVISKLVISDGLKSDFVYMTKCSDFWEVVLIELEDSKKKIFNSNMENIQFSQKFNNAYDQITSWKAYIEDNKEIFLRKINTLKRPLERNPVRVKYVLVIGRNDEKDNSERKISMFAQKNTDDIRVITYDSVISMYQKSNIVNKKMILSPWRDGGFSIKYFPEDLTTSIFAHLKPDELKVSPNIKEVLKKQDYEIENWLKGNLLVYNCKYDAETFSKKSSSLLARAVATMDIKR